MFDLKITMSDGTIHCSTFPSMEALNAYDLTIYGPEHTITKDEQDNDLVITNYTKEIIDNSHLAIIEQIKELEASITPRRLREAILSGDFSFINGVNSQIETLRNQL